MANNDKKFQKLGDEKLDKISGGLDISVSKDDGWLFGLFGKRYLVKESENGTVKTLKFGDKKSLISYLDEKGWNKISGGPKVSFDPKVASEINHG